MTVKFCKGDLFSTPDLRALAHGCNCAGAMGKGIAVQFKKRWPRMFDEYKRRCKQGEFTLGDVFIWEEDDVTVFNLATQRSWRTSADLGAVETSLATLLRAAEQRGIAEVALPRIGAGLGGLDWHDVREVLCRLGSTADTTLLVCEEYVAGESMRSKDTP